MSAEQKTSHRGFTIITVLERLSKGRARLSAKVLASDEDHKRRLGGKKLLQAKRWFDHFADDLAAPVIAGLKHTIDLELAAAKTPPKTASRPSDAKAGKGGATAKPMKALKALKAPKLAKPTKAARAEKAEKVAKAGKSGKADATPKVAKASKVNGASKVGAAPTSGATSAANAGAGKTGLSRTAPARKRTDMASASPIGTPAPTPVRRASARSAG